VPAPIVAIEDAIVRVYTRAAGGRWIRYTLVGLKAFNLSAGEVDGEKLREEVEWLFEGDAAAAAGINDALTGGDLGIRLDARASYVVADEVDEEEVRGARRKAIDDPLALFRGRRRIERRER
jgi:hypothetical protein